MALDAAHAQPSADAPTHTVEAIGARWAVAAGHPLAAAAAARLLQAGGNAVDAGVAAPALECAERGVPISRFTAHQMAGQEATYRQWPTSAALFLRDGRPLRAGEILVQSELAQTIRAMTRAEAAARGGRVAGVR